MMLNKRGRQSLMLSKRMRERVREGKVDCFRGLFALKRVVLSCLLVLFSPIDRTMRNSRLPTLVFTV